MTNSNSLGQLPSLWTTQREGKRWASWDANEWKPTWRGNTRFRNSWKSIEMCYPSQPPRRLFRGANPKGKFPPGTNPWPVPQVCPCVARDEQQPRQEASSTTLRHSLKVEHDLDRG